MPQDASGAEGLTASKLQGWQELQNASTLTGDAKPYIWGTSNLMENKLCLAEPQPGAESGGGHTSTPPPPTTTTTNTTSTHTGFGKRNYLSIREDM